MPRRHPSRRSSHLGKGDDLDGLPEMLITSLEQSRRLLILTRSRMVDVLVQMAARRCASAPRPSTTRGSNSDAAACSTKLPPRAW